ncbi:MAG: putative outer membrane protein [Myxococcales bacterium]|nr:putative outer membrane protein [Myxococcales bacterium]
MYDDTVRWLVIACVLLAGAPRAVAQPSPAPAPNPNPTPSTHPSPKPPDPVAGDPVTPPAAVAPPTPTPPAAVPVPPVPPRKPTAQAKVDREKAEQICAARDPSCDWLATLGGLERTSVRRALTARGYELDPAPWGKVIGTIQVVNEDVFAEKNRVLQFLNTFHVTTKEHVVRREVVIAPGEIWDQALIEETARRLRDPLFSSVIVVLPVISSEPGKVDVLVVTRDIWSLRLNTQYTWQQNKLTDLSLSLSENNFFGLRKVVALGLTMDQGKIEVGPLYIDKNFLGKRLELRARINTIVNREALLPYNRDGLFDIGQLDSEGSSSTISLRRTLWQLSSKWGAGASFTHRFSTERGFDGKNIRSVGCALGRDCVILTRNAAAMTPEDEKLPLIYQQHRWSFTASAVRQFGTKVKQQVTVGYTLDNNRPRLLDSFPGTVAQREAFIARVLPPSEVNSAPFVSYSLFTPRFRTRRNVQTYDLAEDLRTGPDLEVSYGIGLELIGADANFQRGGLGGGYTLPWGRDGSARLGASYSTRYQDGELRDNSASVSTRIVTPNLGYVRIVAESALASRWNERRNGYFAIGSGTGLRGFNIEEFIGDRLFGTQIEARSIPTSLWVLRLGGVVFYEVGGAADTLSTLQLHHDAGVGFRMLLPQTSRELFRFDLAFPLDGAERGSPKFSAGFQSEF